MTSTASQSQACPPPRPKRLWRSTRARSGHPEGIGAQSHGAWQLPAWKAASVAMAARGPPLMMSRTSSNDRPPCPTSPARVRLWLPRQRACHALFVTPLAASNGRAARLTLSQAGGPGSSERRGLGAARGRGGVAVFQPVRVPFRRAGGCQDVQDAEQRLRGRPLFLVSVGPGKKGGNRGSGKKGRGDLEGLGAGRGGSGDSGARRLRTARSWVAERDWRTWGRGAG